MGMKEVIDNGKLAALARERFGEFCDHQNCHARNNAISLVL